LIVFNAQPSRRAHSSRPTPWPTTLGIHNRFCRTGRAVPLLQWMAEHDPGTAYVGGTKPRHAAESAVGDIRGTHRARAPLIESLTSTDRLTQLDEALARIRALPTPT
jgi:hypothetical protein